MAGEARTEVQRRARVVKGWAFRNLTEVERAEILKYLNENGPVPQGYERLDRTVK